MRFTFHLAIAVLLLHAQQVRPTTDAPPPDTDRDGLSDDLEQALLLQFAPQFMISRNDCSGVPAEFVPGLNTPTVRFENSTIYGQVSPVKTPGVPENSVEIHYYHLWKKDCGGHGHPLDAEHVSVLAANGKAVYWFAAAHENTVCDVSQIARASTIKAEDTSARVWISAGKHASFLSEASCRNGCGNDRCLDALPISIPKIVNLGEPGQPMNGSLWIASSGWPLRATMTGTDFPPAAIARLLALPSTDLALFHPGRHPAQGVVAISSSTAYALGDSGENTVTAMSLATESTGGALRKSYRKTIHALGSSATHTSTFLKTGRKQPAAAAQTPERQ